ncbi:MAG: HIT family protein [Acidobacteriota bacterium]|nr:HIT family protein [Acidobacteriota bacterium]
MSDSCIFCRIAAREIPAAIVYEDEHSLAFLDIDPLFPGHTLLIPKQHSETILELPPDNVGPLFRNAQLLTRAVEGALEAEGSFVGINNRISQSVPHLHIHVVPRRKKDGLRGFFWPRRKYNGDEHLAETAEAIRRKLAELTAAAP